MRLLSARSAAIGGIACGAAGVYSIVRVEPAVNGGDTNVHIDITLLGLSLLFASAVLLAIARRLRAAPAPKEDQRCRNQQ